MKVCSSLPSLQSTWLLKSGCFEGAQGSAMLSWVPSPSESISHSPPSHSPSRGCTSLWCFAGNWPEEIWGRILTWVLIIRWVIVFVLLSTYTRDASELLWNVENHLAKKKKKKKFPQFYSWQTPSPMEDAFLNPTSHISEQEPFYSPAFSTTWTSMKYHLT